MPDFVETRPIDWDIEHPPWINPIDSIWAPLRGILDSDNHEMVIFEAMSVVIDRCENTAMPARMAISMCSRLQSDLIEAFATRYEISGADIRDDRIYSAMQPEKRPPNHWMNNLAKHISERKDPRPVLASPVSCSRSRT